MNVLITELIFVKNIHKKFTIFGQEILEINP